VIAALLNTLLPGGEGFPPAGSLPGLERRLFVGHHVTLDDVPHRLHHLGVHLVVLVDEIGRAHV
jgi:hypothetical protein